MPREIFSIVCDDIRIEQGNKVSLMGIYTDGILVSQLPFVFPKLCLAQQFEDDMESHELTVVLVGPKLKKEAKLQSKERTKEVVSIFIGFGGVRVFEEGDYRFETFRDGASEPLITRKFFIRLNPDLKIT